MKEADNTIEQLQKYIEKTTWIIQAVFSLVCFIKLLDGLIDINPAFPT